MNIYELYNRAQSCIIWQKYFKLHQELANIKLYEKLTSFENIYPIRFTFVRLINIKWKVNENENKYSIYLFKKINILINLKYF